MKKKMKSFFAAILAISVLCSTAFSGLDFTVRAEEPIPGRTELTGQYGRNMGNYWNYSSGVLRYSRQGDNAGNAYSFKTNNTDYYRLKASTTYRLQFEYQVESVANYKHNDGTPFDSMYIAPTRTSTSQGTYFATRNLSSATQIGNDIKNGVPNDAIEVKEASTMWHSVDITFTTYSDLNQNEQGADIFTLTVLANGGTATISFRNISITDYSDPAYKAITVYPSATAASGEKVYGLADETVASKLETPAETTRKFSGYYIDKEYKTKLENQTFQEVTAVYAKWGYLTIGDFTSDTSPYKRDDFEKGKTNGGAFNHERWSVDAANSKGDANGALKYSFTHDATTGLSGKVGEAKGNTGKAPIPVAVMPDANAYYTLSPATEYTVTFDYKVVSIAPQSDIDYIGFYVGRADTATNNNVRSGEKRRVDHWGTLNEGNANTLYVEKETAAGDWKQFSYTFTTYDWVNGTSDLADALKEHKTAGWDKLVIMMNGYGEVLIDNIVVSTASDNAKVTIHSDYASDTTLTGLPGTKITFPSFSDVPRMLEGYYTDKECTKAFTATGAVFGDAGSTTELWTKWGGYKLSDFTSAKSPYYALESYKKNVDGNFYNHSRWGISSESTTEEAGGSLQYKYTYSSTNSNVVGDTKGNLPNVDTASAVLENNAKHFLLEPNKEYVVSFKYKVLSVDGSGQDKNVAICLGRARGDKSFTAATATPRRSLSKYNTITDGNQSDLVINAGEVSEDWQTVSHYFKTYDWVNGTADLPDSLKDDKTAPWNVLCFTGFGYGEVVIDDIIVSEKAENHEIRLHSSTSSEVTSYYGLPGSEIILPAPSAAPRELIGYYTDSACTKEFSETVFGEAGKVTDVYVKWSDYVYIKDFDFEPYNLANFKTGGGGGQFGNARYGYYKDETENSMLRYQFWYKSSVSGEGAIGSRCGNTGGIGSPAFVSITNNQNEHYKITPGHYYTVSFDYDVQSLATSGNGIGETLNGVNEIGFSVARVKGHMTAGNEGRDVSSEVTMANTVPVLTVDELGKGHFSYSFKAYDQEWSHEGKVHQTDWNLLAIAMSGYGIATIDNIKVMDMSMTDETVIYYNTNSASEFAPTTTVIDKSLTLPTPTKSGYTFTGWYTNSGCTQKFNPATYKRTTGVLHLFAGWKNANLKMDGEEFTNFKDAPYSLINEKSGNAVIASPKFTSVKEGKDDIDNFDDGMIRYQYAYADENSSGLTMVGGKLVDKNGIKYLDSGFGVRGDFKGKLTLNAGMLLGKADPAAENGYSLYKLDSAKSYYVTFRYRVESVENIVGNSIKIGVARLDDATTLKYYADSINTFGTNAVMESASTGWKTGTYAFTTFDYLNEGPTEMNKESFNLGLLVSGFGVVYFDDVVVTRMDKVKETVIQYNTGNGDVLEDQIEVVSASTKLPTGLVREGFEFGGWYTDPSCTVKFEPAKYKRTTGILKLYAKWIGIEKYKIDFEDPSYYYMASDLKDRNFGKAYQRYNFINEKGTSNKVLQYKYGYAETQNSVVGACKGPGGSGVASFVLYDAQKKAEGYSDNLSYLKVAKGDVYQFVLRYKVADVDLSETSATKASYLAISATTAYYTNSSAANLTQASKVIIADRTSDWQTASFVVKIEDIKTDGKLVGDALCLGVNGYGEMLIDDIEIYKITGAGVAFDTDKGTIVTPKGAKRGQSITLPQNLTRKDCVFEGWYKDPDFKEKVKGTTLQMTAEPQVLYARFITCQVKQDFEHYYPYGMRFWFHDMEVIREGQENYSMDYIHRGKASVRRIGEENYSRQFTLFDPSMNPLTIGEKYILTIWVNPIEVFIDTSAIRIRHDPLFEKTYSDSDVWKDKMKMKTSEQYDEVIVCSELEEGKWQLLTYEFTAKSRYLSISVPEFMDVAFDDCTITWAEAEGYEIEKADSTDDDVEVEQEKKNIRTDLNIDLSKLGLSLKEIILIVSVGIVLIAAVVLLVIFRKKVFKFFKTLFRKE